MKPATEGRLRGILVSIGFEKMERLAPYRAGLAWRSLSPTGLKIYKNYVVAKEGEARAEKLIDAVRLISGMAENLNEAEQEIIQQYTNLFADYSTGKDFPTIAQTVRSAQLIIGGLFQLQRHANLEATAQSNGAPRNVAIQHVSDALAEIFVIGLGQRITVGVKADENKPSTKFLETLGEVCSVLDLSTGNIRRAAENTQAALTEEHHQRLLEIHGGKADKPPFRSLMFR